MTPIIAQGDMTIVDYNDAMVLQPIIQNTTGVPYQIFKTDSLAFSTLPSTSWDTTINSGVNLTLIPYLYQSGTVPVELCSTSAAVTIIWASNYADGTTYVNLNSTQTAMTDANFALVGASARLGIKITKNLFGNAPVLSKSAKIRATMSYLDPISGLTSTSVAFFDIDVLSATKGAVALIITSDKGYAFKNGVLNQADAIVLTASLMRGSTLDTVGLVYTWKQDGVVVGGNTQTYTVTAAQVYSKSVFQCNVIDAADDNVNYTATVTIVDMLDPFSVEVSSDKGGAFKTGETITATLTARIAQGGMPIVPPAGTAYIWNILNSAGANGTWSAAAVTAIADLPSRPSYTTGALTATSGGVIGGLTIPNIIVTNIRVGHTVTGTGVPAGTRVVKIVGNAVSLSNEHTAAGSVYTFSTSPSERLTQVATCPVTQDDITVRGTIQCKAVFA